MSSSGVTSLRSLMVLACVALSAGEEAPAAAPAAALAAIDAPDFAVLVIDLGGVPYQWIAHDPVRYPWFRSLAREGVSAVRVEGTGNDPRAALVGFLSAGGSTLVRRACERVPSDRVWVLAPRAGYLADVAAGAQFFAPDLRLPAFRGVVERYGLPAEPLTPAELVEIGKLRAQYGAELRPGAEELAVLLSGRGVAPHPDAAVMNRAMTLLRERSAAFIVAIVDDADVAHRDIDAAKQAVQATDRAMGELWSLLSEEPYRGRTAFAYVSIVGRASAETPSGHEGKGAGYALCIGPPFRRGVVLQEPVRLAGVRAALFAALGAGPAGGADIPAGLLATEPGSND